MPISYAWIQIRISESLTPLPYRLGLSAAVGLSIGCLLANLFSPIGIPDLVFGPLLSLFAGLLSWKASFGRRTLACLYPIIVNALGVSIYVSFFYQVPYAISVLSILVSEALVVLLVGYPLLLALEKTLLMDDTGSRELMQGRQEPNSRKLE